MSKDNVSSPTVSTKALLLTWLIDAMEGRDVEQVRQFFVHALYSWCVHECEYTHRNQIGSGDENLLLAQ